MKKQQLVSGLVVVLLAGTVMVTPAYAAETSNTNNMWGGLVSFFSSKFGLEQSKVQSAMDEFKQKHKAEMKDKMIMRFNTKLDSLVKDGKITEAQKKAIEDKQAEMMEKVSKENMQNLTPEQRKQKMEEQKAEMEAWAKEQGIDMQYLFPGGMKKKMKRFDMWEKKVEAPQQ